MVGVPQDDLGFDIVFKLALMHRLDCTRRADGHEDGSLYSAVGSLDPSGASLRVLILCFKKKLHSLLSLRLQSGPQKYVYVREHS